MSNQKRKKLPFKCVLKQGHAGAGRYDELIQIVFAKDSVEAMDIANNLPSVKKCRRKMGRLKGIMSIEPLKEVKK